MTRRTRQRFPTMAMPTRMGSRFSGRACWRQTLREHSCSSAGGDRELRHLHSPVRPLPSNSSICGCFCLAFRLVDIVLQECIQLIVCGWDRRHPRDQMVIDRSAYGPRVRNARPIAERGENSKIFVGLELGANRSHVILIDSKQQFAANGRGHIRETWIRVNDPIDAHVRSPAPCQAAAHRPAFNNNVGLAVRISDFPACFRFHVRLQVCVS